MLGKAIWELRTLDFYSMVLIGLPTIALMMLSEKIALRGFTSSESRILHNVPCIQPSMSRVGNPYDNAKAESFMKTLKQEEVDGRNYRDLKEARDAIGAFIEEVYNHQRLH